MTLIGPKPVVETPKFVLPFRAEGDLVLDANGKRFAGSDPEGEYPEIDHEMAQAAADALNEKFGDRPGPERKLRTFIAFRKRDMAGPVGSLTENRCYEVSPGEFAWATSRAAARKLPTHGLAFDSYRYVDVETGEELGGEPEKTTVTAEVFSYHADATTNEKRSAWMIVGGKAYYRECGTFESSDYTPNEVRRDSEECPLRGVIEIDPAILAGVEGTE